MSDETDAPVDDWTAEQVRAYATDQGDNPYRGYFIGAVKWKERVANMIARDRLTIAELTAALTAVRAERDGLRAALDSHCHGRPGESCGACGRSFGPDGPTAPTVRAEREAIDDAFGRACIALVTVGKFATVLDARRALSPAGGAQDGNPRADGPVNRPAESPGIGPDLATVDAAPRAQRPGERCGRCGGVIGAGVMAGGCECQTPVSWRATPPKEPT